VLASRENPSTIHRSCGGAWINSDDPAYFGGYADDDYAAVAQAFAFGDTTLALLAHNSVTASFLPHHRKAAVHAAIDAWSGGQEEHR
jgi:adenosine deaminase